MGTFLSSKFILDSDSLHIHFTLLLFQDPTQHPTLFSRVRSISGSSWLWRFPSFFVFCDPDSFQECCRMSLSSSQLVWSYGFWRPSQKQSAIFITSSQRYVLSTCAVNTTHWSCWHLWSPGWGGALQVSTLESCIFIPLSMLYFYKEHQCVQAARPHRMGRYAPPP